MIKQGTPEFDTLWPSELINEVGKQMDAGIHLLSRLVWIGDKWVEVEDK